MCKVQTCPICVVCLFVGASSCTSKDCSHGEVNLEHSFLLFQKPPPVAATRLEIHTGSLIFRSIGDIYGLRNLRWDENNLCGSGKPRPMIVNLGV